MTRTNLSKTYNYVVIAKSDSSAYLWSGHGLENAPNPTIYIRSDDELYIKNESGGHLLKITKSGSADITESNGSISLTSPSNGSTISAGTYNYICQAHPSAMKGEIIVSDHDVDGTPDNGYGTGLLPARGNAITAKKIVTKINEIVTKSESGGRAAVSQSPPDNPANGDLWFNLTEAELYVYADTESAWIQTNGGSGSGGGVGIGDLYIYTAAMGNMVSNYQAYINNPASPKQAYDTSKTLYILPSMGVKSVSNPGSSMIEIPAPPNNMNLPIPKLMESGQPNSRGFGAFVYNGFVYLGQVGFHGELITSPVALIQV